MMEERWSLKKDLWDNNDEDEEDGDKEEIWKWLWEKSEGD